MYYPYLRGRQFELIALREYALIHGANNNVVPIIEPVKKTFNSLKLAIPKFIEGEMKFALILNPQVGEIKDFSSITSELQEQLSDTSKWIPAFIVTNNIDVINLEIEKNNYDEIMIICSDRADTASSNFLTFISNRKIKYVVSKENRILKRKISEKDFIRLDDNFNSQKRNKDFLSISEEKFTEEHLFYKADNYAGFSDYTVLISDFIEGGGAPYAVAIHLTYEKDSEEIWIRHFTSISNDDIANIQGKFEEAARKAVNFINTKPIETEAALELRRYYDEAKYPGLGIVKKIAIKNHIELINKVISV
ncbi:MAG: hypothetical protein ACJA2M_003014 [Polaribacter sp.]|jgi:hypothetical protein